MTTGAPESIKESICLRIGDITLALSSIDPCLKIRLEGDLDLFSVPSADADLAINAAWGALSSESPGDKIFDSGGAWQVYRRQDAFQFTCRAAQFGSTPYKVARVTGDFRSAEIVLHRPFFAPEESVYPLQYPLDEVLVLNLLARGRGVEMHACGVVDSSGVGFLFPGMSGSGKTTMARLWSKEKGALILSDDRIILRQDRRKMWLYGTPWHGEEKLSSPSRALLKAVFFLRHGPVNNLRARAGAQAAAELFARSFPVFYSPEGLQYSLEFFDKLTATVPCYELDVLPDQHVIDFIRQATLIE